MMMNDDEDDHFEFKYNLKIEQDSYSDKVQDPDWTTGHEINEFSSSHKSSSKRCDDPEESESEEEMYGKRRKRSKIQNKSSHLKRRREYYKRWIENKSEEELKEFHARHVYWQRMYMQRKRSKMGTTATLVKSKHSRENMSEEKLKKLRARQAEWQRKYRQRKKMAELANKKVNGDEGEDPDKKEQEDTGNTTRRKGRTATKEEVDELTKLRRARHVQNQMRYRERKKMRMLLEKKQTGGDDNQERKDDGDEGREMNHRNSMSSKIRNMKSHKNSRQAYFKSWRANMTEAQLKELRARQAYWQRMYRQRKKIAELGIYKETGGDDEDKEEDPDWIPGQEMDGFSNVKNATRKRKKDSKETGKRLTKTGNIDQNQSNELYRQPQRQPEPESDEERIASEKKSEEELQELLRKARQAQDELMFRQRKKIDMLLNNKETDGDDEDKKEHEEDRDWISGHEIDDFSNIENGSTKSSDNQEEIEEKHRHRKLAKENNNRWSRWRANMSADKLKELRARQANWQRICRQRKKMETEANKKVNGDQVLDKKERGSDNATWIQRRTATKEEVDEMTKLRRARHVQNQTRYRERKKMGMLLKKKLTEGDNDDDKNNKKEHESGHVLRKESTSTRSCHKQEGDKEKAESKRRQRKRAEKPAAPQKRWRGKKSEEELMELRARQAYWQRMCRQRKKMAKLADKQAEVKG